ncbi:hypothetical protein C8R43DRAFT_440122 [Mycena crocata]|nr:hypothetical protein C8R43DRAFT_440122 [Mycena crocata]
MNSTVPATAFNDYLDFVLPEIYETSVEIFLYGVSLVLFSFAAYLLYHKECDGKWILVVGTFVMAGLATTQMAIRIQVTVLSFKIIRLLVQGETFPDSTPVVHAIRAYDAAFFIGYLFLVTNNAVADSLFIYRCFIIWGRRWQVIVVPLLMLVTTTVLGYLWAYEVDYGLSGSYIDAPVALFILNVLTNIVLMALTAGRIWWIRRDARVVLGSGFIRRYNNAIEIIMESGSIYCISVIVYFVAVSLPRPIILLESLIGGALPQIMNIAPTLIIVRVGLGHATEDSVANMPGEKNVFRPAPVVRQRDLTAIHPPPPETFLDICQTASGDAGTDMYGHQV